VGVNVGSLVAVGVGVALGVEIGVGVVVEVGVREGEAVFVAPGVFVFGISDTGVAGGRLRQAVVIKAVVVETPANFRKPRRDIFWTFLPYTPIFVPHSTSCTSFRCHTDMAHSAPAAFPPSPAMWDSATSL